MSSRDQPEVAVNETNIRRKLCQRHN